MDRSCKQIKAKFEGHKYHATKTRGLEFTLTYDQWCDIWEQSGKWDQRGAFLGGYVMCRKGDTGGYTSDNVFIESQTFNVKDAHNNGRCDHKYNKRAAGRSSDTDIYYLTDRDNTFLSSQHAVAEYLEKGERWVSKLVSDLEVLKLKDTTTKYYITPQGEFTKMKHALEVQPESLRGGKITRQTLHHRFKNDNFPEYYTEERTHTKILNKGAPVGLEVAINDIFHTDGYQGTVSEEITDYTHLL